VSERRAEQAIFALWCFDDSSEAKWAVQLSDGWHYTALDVRTSADGALCLERPSDGFCSARLMLELAPGQWLKRVRLDG
jgi:hypothetical protein